MAYKLDSYVEAHKILSSKPYSEIKNNPDLYTMFAMFVSHCFNGYNPSVFHENCSTCEHNHLVKLRNEGYQAAVKADLLNSKPYRLRNSKLTEAYWVNNSNKLCTGVNLTDENVEELIKKEVLKAEHFEFYPADWFHVEQESEQEQINDSFHVEQEPVKRKYTKRTE